MAVNNMTASSVHCPFPGMRPYRQSEELLFEGRDQETARASDLWRTRTLTVLHGAPGTGKSSLLHSGVVPRMQRLGARVLPVGRVAGGPPFPEASALSPNPLTRTLLRSWAPERPLPPLSIGQFLRQIQHRSKPVFACIDHIEDMYLGDRSDERRELLHALTSAQHVHLLLCVRDDRLDALRREIEQFIPDIALFELTGLSPHSAVEAIRDPVRDTTSRVVSPNVAEALVEDLTTVRIVDQAGRIRSERRLSTVHPWHLQAVCTHMWRVWPEDERSLTETQHVAANDALREALWLAIQEVATGFGYDPIRLCSWLATTFISSFGAAQQLTEGLAETAGMPNSLMRALVNRSILQVRVTDEARVYTVGSDRLLEPLGQLGQRAGAIVPTIILPADRLCAAVDALVDGDQDRAERHVRQAAAASQDMRTQIGAHTILGNIFYARGDLSEALDAYQRVLVLLETQQDKAAVGVMLAAIGRISLARGDVAAAQGQLRAAAARLPVDPSIRIELARALAQAGQQMAALSILRTVMTVAEDDEARILHDHIQDEIGDPAT
ncbi:nSTAND1 domain-containing NTPase [Nonomuraea gerenzanensis]